MLKVDFQNNRKILVVDIHLKPGKTLSQTYANGNFSLITDNQKFDQFLEQLHNYGRIKLLSAQKPDKSYEDIFEKLTPRQKDSIFLAKELGYYVWPRRINAT